MILSGRTWVGLKDRWRMLLNMLRKLAIKFDVVYFSYVLFGTRFIDRFYKGDI